MVKERGSERGVCLGRLKRRRAYIGEEALSSESNEAEEINCIAILIGKFRTGC
jgi:hypothetical protein